MPRNMVALALAFVGSVGVSAANATVDTIVRATGPTPFAAGCNGATQTGTNFPNAEVEPWIAANPRNPNNLIATWQQDRWSNGGSQGLVTGVSNDRGRSWTRPTPPTFSRCAGGNATNGGDYERASDPWVSISPNGTAHQISLSINDSNPTSAILVSSSRNGGQTWGPVATLQKDTVAELFNDKESITADPTNSRYVYAVWDRLQVQDPNNPASPFSGDTLFARSADGGVTWEPTKTILDFPDNSGQQSLGNQIVVLGDGTLVNSFNLLDNGTPLVAVMRSTDKGATWSEPIIIDLLFTSAITAQGGVIDPSDGSPIRTGDLLPEVAADPRRGSETLHIAWQDLRFTLLGAVANDQIVMSTSTDGGLTWGDPKRVSANRNVQAFTGSVDVNDAGRIGVTYYDFTNDDPAGGPLDTDAWFTASRDGGATFSARERLTTDSFDMRGAPNARGFFVGDYEGLTHVGNRFIPFFVSANNGNTANPTDGYSANVRPSFAASALGPRVVAPGAQAGPAATRAALRGSPTAQKIVGAVRTR